MKSKKTMWAAIGVTILLLAVVIYWIFRSFDASGYVNAVLAQYLKGDTTAAFEMMDDVTEETLLTQYEEGVAAFVESNVANGIEMDDTLKENYIALCKKIFADMKYKVGETEKTSRSSYEVPVTYQSVDIFEKFAQSLAEEKVRLTEKVERGEYKGTLEEINAQMQKEFLEQSYGLFEEAYNAMEFSEETTIVFHVEKGNNDLFGVKESEIADFIAKIMGLDENQD